MTKKIVDKNFEIKLSLTQFGFHLYLLLNKITKKWNKNKLVFTFKAIYKRKTEKIDWENNETIDLNRALM
jgi:hypothetical protein